MANERIPLLWLQTTEQHLSHLNDVPLSVHAAEMEDSRRTIQAHMNGMELAYAHARMRLNFLLPVSRMPDEILARVFTFAAAMEELTHQGPFQHRIHFFAPLNVSHVCRRWCDVALTNPTVWCRPFLHLGHKWTTIVLKRAKQVPLLIHLYRPSVLDRVHGDKSLVSRVINRTRSLELGLMHTDLELFVKELTMAAPHLERLSIALPKSYWGYEVAVPALPENIFDNNTPCLRVVHLDRFLCMPWDASIFADTVVDLHVVLLTPKENAPTVPSTCAYSKLLEALRRMKRLEHLSLDSCITHALNVNVKAKPPVRTVPLHLLTSLTIHDSATSCALFLRQLKIPGRARIKIDCWLKVPTVPGAEELSQALSAHYASNAVRGSRLSLHKLGMQQFESNARHAKSEDPDLLTTVSLKCWKRPKVWHDAKTEPQVEIYLRPMDHLPMIDREFILRELCVALPLKHLRTLDISRLPYNFSAPVWIDTFRHVRKIKFISASAPAALSLARVLGRDIAHAESGIRCQRSQADLQRPLSLPRFLFPWLRRLVMDVLDEQTARELDLSRAKRYLRTPEFKRVDGVRVDNVEKEQGKAKGRGRRKASTKGEKAA